VSQEQPRLQCACSAGSTGQSSYKPQKAMCVGRSRVDRRKETIRIHTPIFFAHSWPLLSSFSRTCPFRIPAQRLAMKFARLSLLGACLTGALLCLADEVSKKHPDYQPEGGFNVLSFDGGGVRGISSLYILKILMERLDPINPPKPYEYFDMIAGTSTGGSVVKFPKKA